MGVGGVGLGADDAEGYGVDEQMDGAVVVAVKGLAVDLGELGDLDHGGGGLEVADEGVVAEAVVVEHAASVDFSGGGAVLRGGPVEEALVVGSDADGGCGHGRLHASVALDVADFGIELGVLPVGALLADEGVEVAGDVGGLVR